MSARTGVFGGDENEVHLVSKQGVESWPRMGKAEVAERLVAWIARERARRAHAEAAQ